VFGFYLLKIQSVIRLMLRVLGFVKAPLLKTFVDCSYGKDFFGKNVGFYQGITGMHEVCLYKAMFKARLRLPFPKVFLGHSEPFELGSTPNCTECMVVLLCLRFSMAACLWRRASNDSSGIFGGLPNCEEFPNRR
jgi:hypothetical protein